MKRVTLNDIARKTGFHATTVSMALRHHPEIPAKTRELIENAARKLNYTPDPVLAALNAYRQDRRKSAYQATLAWINDGPRMPEGKRPWWYEEHFLSAKAQAQALGYKLDEWCIPELQMDGKGVSRMLSSRNIPGLVVAPLPSGKTHTLDFEWNRFSAVAIGYSLTTPRLHVITSHQYRTMQDMIAKLRSFGYRRISLVMDTYMDKRVNHAWSAMFWVDYHQQPRSRRVAPLFFDKVCELDVLRAWYEHQKPEAIVCDDQDITLFLEKIGVKPGRDVAVASTRVTTTQGIRGHAGMNQNSKAVGAMSIDVLAGLIRHNSRGIPLHSDCTLMESVWQSGWTVNETPPSR